ncbi:unnamed protein product [Adineta ricciae]|uniref:Uncharacterized protein n=1 Tax=Adineta ricciae TaxID=249248 RepID=A0A815SD64_ADIRI|nr:unnamed protein product [Adineta ricciae]
MMQKLNAVFNFISALGEFKRRFLFGNLCRLSDKFKVQLSWHFSATAHGKGVVDGIGRTIKRLVYLAILSGQSCDLAADFVRIGQTKTTAIELIEMEQYRINHSKAQLEGFFSHLNQYQKQRKYILSKH